MSGWAYLSLELRRQVIHLVIDSSTDSIYHYATISREWQEYVEEKTFSSLRVLSTQLQDLHSIMTPRRQSHVRDMIFEVILPEYDPKAVEGRRETMAAKAANNRAFTNAVLAFFDILTNWKPSKKSRGISLRLGITCPSDRAPGKVGHTYRRSSLYKTSMLEFLPEGVDFVLPPLQVISEFHAGGGSRSSTVAPKACCDMAAQMPNVSTLEWHLGDNDRRKNPRRRVKARQDLVAGLKTIPDSVRHFTFSYGRLSDSSHWEPPQLYDGDDTTPDPLSVALRHISRHCITLDFTTTISSEIFWPVSLLSSPASSPSLSEPHSDHFFPYLEVVYLCPNHVTPLGEWMFTGEPSDDDLAKLYYSSDESNDDDDDVSVKFERQFGYRPDLDPDLAEPYLLAAVTAAQHMPRLKEFCIRWRGGMGQYGLGYLATDNKGQKRPRAKLYTWGSPPIELSREVREGWRAVTANLLGSPGAMDFIARDDDGRGFEWDS
jgi:hypothetical protein